MSEPSQSIPRKKRVLVVDDDARLANALVALIRAHGHEAWAHYRGDDALRDAASRDPDLVFLDIHMPGARGDEIAQQLRASGSQAVIIAHTGSSADDGMYERAFDHFVTKPITEELLLELLGGSVTEPSPTQ